MRMHIAGTYGVMLALFVCGVAPAVVPAREASEEDLLERVKGAVVYVYHERAAGSGFLISSDGYLWTNGHVVRKATRKKPKGIAERIVVVLDNGDEYSAKVLGYSMQPDCALVKINAKGPLPFFKQGDSGVLRVGQKVFAIGQPGGMKKSVTKGILGNTRRSSLGTIVPLLQHDAEINPGNSGGPLINEDGEVVGINTYKMGGAGLGGAFPINALKTLEQHFRKHGRFRKSWIPMIMIDPLKKRTLEWLGLPAGILISKVLPGSPADRADLKTGDIVTEVDGRRLKGTDDAYADALEFNWDILTRPLESGVALKVVRQAANKEKRHTKEIRIALEEQPKGLAELAEHSISELGIGLREWTPWLAFSSPKTPKNSLNVSSIVPGGSMYRAGVQGGDFLASVEGERSTGFKQGEAEFHKHLSKGKKWIHFTVYRNGVPLELVVAPEYALKEKTIALVCPPGRVEPKGYARVREHLARVGAEVMIVGVTKAPIEVKKGEEVTPEKVLGALDLSRYDGFVFLDIPKEEHQLDYGLGSHGVKAILESKKAVGAIGAAPAALVQAVPDLAARKLTFRSDWLATVASHRPNYTGKSVERDGSLVTADGKKDSLEPFLRMFDHLIKIYAGTN